MKFTITLFFITLGLVCSACAAPAPTKAELKQLWSTFLKGIPKYGSPGIVKVPKVEGALNYNDKDNNAEAQQLDAALELESLRKAMNSGEAQDYNENENNYAKKQKIEWDVAKDTIKNGPSVLNAINGGEAQDSDDVAEAQLIGAALTFASILASLANLLWPSG